MNRTLSHLDALLERRNLSGGDRLASLNRSIDSIERKLGDLGNSAASTLQEKNLNTGTNGTNFEALERRVRELTNGLSQQDGSSAGPRRAGAGNPLAEIAERKRVLNNTAQMSASQFVPHGGQGGAPTFQHPQVSEVASQAATAEIQQLGARIDALRNELASELSGINRSVAHNTEQLSSPEDLERIAQGIRELQKAPRYDPSEFDTLHQELDEIRASLSSSVRHEDFDAGINDLNVRLDQISGGMSKNDPSAIDALHRGLDDIRASLSSAVRHEDFDTGINDLNVRLDKISNNTASDNTAALMSRIDALSQLVGNQSNAETINKLDQRLQSLVNTVQSMASNQSSPDENDNDLKAIESRLDEITRAIVAVSVTEQNQPPADHEAISRMESQITTLAQGIEAVVRKNDDEQFTQLANRIENLGGNMEAMNASIQNAAVAPDAGISAEIEEQLRQLASRLDMGAVEKHRGEDQLSDLASRIDGLSDKFSSFAIAASGDSANVVPVSITPDTSQIENQLQQLADRLDNAISGNSADNQLQNLELQIAEIASKLGSVEPVTVDLGGVESRLGVIEQNLDTGRDFTLEAATKAAQSAVEMMGDQGLSSELINALAEDLRALQTAASQTESRTIDSIDGVQAALNTVVSRLGAIENQLKDNSQFKSANVSEPPMQASVFGKENMVASGVVGASSSQLMAEFDAAENTKSVDVGSSVLEKINQAPSIDPSDVIQESVVAKVEDNRPLEPGSGAPDIPALVKRASEKFSADNNGSEVNSEKTDFVAAARRAAQAAVTEVKAVKAEVNEKPQSASLLNKIKDIPRKPIIIAAAAVLMAVIAFAGSKILFGGDGSTAVVAVNPVVVEEPEKSTLVEPATAPEDTGVIEPQSTVRPAVPNTTPTEGSMAASVNTGGINTTPENGEMPANVTSSFDTGLQPIQTDKFASRTGSGSGTPSAAENINEAAPKMATAANGENITSAPLPPDSLGSTALRQAAATGDVRAQHEVALRYTNGTGVKRDLAEAAKWYERAAAQEFAPAQYRLGSLFEKGRGVKRDLNTAMNWYSRAAELGNARAMHNLAVISAMGADGKPDMSKAFSWFTKAANHGVKDSQFNLGILYGQGMGVKQDLAESYKWFALAAKTGDTDAAKKRDEVANVMDPKALEKARIIVRDWRPEKLVASANQVTIPEEWRKKAKVQNARLSAKETIRLTQTMLNKLGYKVGAPDGKFGPKTRRAIVNFQRKSGLSPTGTINADLIKALKGLSV